MCKQIEVGCAVLTITWDAAVAVGNSKRLGDNADLKTNSNLGNLAVPFVVSIRNGYRANWGN
jgi:hypothetical protein